MHEKLTPFDIVTKLLIPALSLIAIIVVQFTTKQARLATGLLVLTFLVVLISFFPTFRSMLHNQVERHRDNEATQKAFSELRKYANRFAEFVDNGRNDTLHRIVTDELLRGHNQRLNELGIPNVELWHSLFYSFVLRTNRGRSTATELIQALSEFHTFVGTYNNYCVAAVFQHLPQEFNAGMTPEVRRSLSSFHLRFSRFAMDYEEFAKELSASRPIFERVPYSISHTRPL